MDFIRFSRNLWDSIGIQILRDSMGFYRTLQESNGFYRIQWGSVGFNRILSDSIGFYMILQDPIYDSIRSYRILQDSEKPKMLMLYWFLYCFIYNALDKESDGKPKMLILYWFLYCFMHMEAEHVDFTQGFPLFFSMSRRLPAGSPTSPRCPWGTLQKLFFYLHQNPIS